MLGTAVTLGVGKCAISSASVAPRLPGCMKALHKVGCLTHLPDDSTSKKGSSSQGKSSGMKRDAGTGQRYHHSIKGSKSSDS